MLAILICAPALAQTTDNEATRQEMDRLSSHTFSNAKRRGYRNRVTASDYELEFQMQQLDKQRAADDQARYNALLDEEARRGRAQAAAERQAQMESHRLRSEDYHRQTMDYLGQQRQKSEQAYANRMQQYEADSRAWQARQEARNAQGRQALEDRFARTRAETARLAQEANRVQPIQSAPITGPSFPIPQPDYTGARYLPRYERQTPLQALREGQELGRALGEILTGPRDRAKRARKDAIVKKHVEGTATREDYAQLVDDGYSDLALQLFNEYLDHGPRR